MNATATVAPAPDADLTAVEQALVKGDLQSLRPEQRVTYYRRVCESLGLNPLTRPFDYLLLGGRLVLYARKDATDQLRRLHGVSITGIEERISGDLLIVTARARASDGREDCDIGAVSLRGRSGDELGNAYMRALTKAKRRVTLSICGLGWLDESEVESVPAGAVRVDVATGEVVADGAPDPDHDRARRALWAAVRERAAAGWDEQALRAALAALYPDRCADDQVSTNDLTTAELRALRETVLHEPAPSRPAVDEGGESR